MVVQVFTDGDVLYDHALDNKLSFQNNMLVGKTGTAYLHVPILLAGDAPKVRLYLFGKAAGTGAAALAHGAVGHYHGQIELLRNTSNVAIASGADSTPGWVTNKVRVTAGDSGSDHDVGRLGYSNSLLYTDVPKFVQIWIDGTQYTAAIGDPNAKGATMYTAGSGWGINGTTVWDTGELDLSSTISWTVGNHYIELKETGGFGGVLVYTLLVN